MTENKNIRPGYYSPHDPYEVVKVINAWGVSFQLGSALRYIKRAGKKDPSKHVEDLLKARTYIDLEIERINAAEPQTVTANPEYSILHEGAN